MFNVALVRIRDQKTAQWDLSALVKRALSPVLGRKLVAFEAIQGQPLVPLRVMGLWAAAFRGLAQRHGIDLDVEVIDSTAEYHSFWQYQTVIFFMDSSNAKQTISAANACVEQNIKTYIASGAPDIYREYSLEADGGLAWVSLSEREAAGILGVSDALEEPALVPFYRATCLGDYCPYFVPVSLARYGGVSGKPEARDAGEIMHEIRELRNSGILSPEKRILFDNPFDDVNAGMNLLLILARQLVTEDIIWGAWFSCNEADLPDGRKIALLRRSGMALACLGESMNFCGLMHDCSPRPISEKLIAALKARGVMVVVRRLLDDRMESREPAYWNADIVSARLYVPQPEMQVFREMRLRGEIMDFNWAHYRGTRVVYRSRQDARVLEGRYCELSRRFNSVRQTFAHLVSPSLAQLRMFYYSPLPFLEMASLRLALAASKYANDGKRVLRQLANVVLIGKY